MFKVEASVPAKVRVFETVKVFKAARVREPVPVVKVLPLMVPKVLAPVTDNVPPVSILLPIVVAACAAAATNKADKIIDKVTETDFPFLKYMLIFFDILFCMLLN
ncbi:MAG: hypothetical protein AAB497_02890 [Patescibacteria group bacterium]